MSVIDLEGRARRAHGPNAKGSAEIFYGPPWPNPADVAAFLEQARQFTRAAIADARPFQPTGALVLLVDGRSNRFVIGDLSHALRPTEALAALDIVRRRILRTLDPDGELEVDDEGPEAA